MTKTYLVDSWLFRVYSILSLSLSCWGHQRAGQVVFSTFHFRENRSSAKELVQADTGLQHPRLSARSFRYLQHTRPVGPHLSSGSPQCGPCCLNLIGSLSLLLYPRTQSAPLLSPLEAKSRLDLVTVAALSVFFVLSSRPKGQCGQRHKACKGTEQPQEMTRSWVWLEHVLK